MPRPSGFEKLESLLPPFASRVPLLENTALRVPRSLLENTALRASRSLSVELAQASSPRREAPPAKRQRKHPLCPSRLAFPCWKTLFFASRGNANICARMSEPSEARSAPSEAANSKRSPPGAGNIGAGGVRKLVSCGIEVAGRRLRCKSAQLPLAHGVKVGSSQEIGR